MAEANKLLWNAKQTPRLHWAVHKKVVCSCLVCLWFCRQLSRGFHNETSQKGPSSEYVILQLLSWNDYHLKFVHCHVPQICSEIQRYCPHKISSGKLFPLIVWQYLSQICRRILCSKTLLAEGRILRWIFLFFVLRFCDALMHFPMVWSFSSETAVFIRSWILSMENKAIRVCFRGSTAFSSILHVLGELGYLGILSFTQEYKEC